MRRINTQVRQRRRQEQFHLPPSGLTEHRNAESTLWSRDPADVDEPSGEEAVQHPQQRPVSGTKSRIAKTVVMLF